MTGRTQLAAAFLGVAVVAIALRAPVAGLPYERDEGGYAYVAWRWLAGEVPYRDVFDQKPPGIFAVYALARALGGGEPAAVRWTAQVLLLGALAALLALGRRCGEPAAGIAAALFAAVLTVDWTLLGNAVNTETLALAPLSAGAWTAWRARDGGGLRDAVATGALGGLALLFKPVVAPIVAFELATAAWAPRPAARLLAGGLAAATPAAAVALGFAAAGAFPPFWDATVANNLAYAGGTPLSLYPHYFALQFRDTLAPFAPVYALALLAPLAGRPGPRPGGVAGPDWRWVAGWLMASLLAVSAGGFFRRHYFLLAVPPLALLAGLGLAGAMRRLAGARQAAVATVTVAALAVAYAVLRSPWYYAPGASDEARLARIYGSNPFPEAEPLGRWLRERRAPGDTAFVYGSEPELLVYAGLPSASRYIYVYPLTMPAGQPRDRQREVLAGLRADPPRFLVGCFLNTSLLDQPGTPPDLRRGLRALVEERYRVAAVVPFAADRSTRIVEGKAAATLWRERPLWDGATPWAPFVVWERREGPPAAP